MSPYSARIGEQLREAELILAHEMEEQQRRWHYRLHRGRVWFDDELLSVHRRLRKSIPAYVLEGSILSLLTAPIIYSLVVPLALLDLWVTTYQWICFPVYGIARVRRRDYCVIDRRKLAYLNGIEQANCTVCSYANGLIAYVREWLHARNSTGARSNTRVRFPLRTPATTCSSTTGMPRPIGMISPPRACPCDRIPAVRIEAKRHRSRIGNDAWGAQ
jgi:hypothetical protein